MTTSDRVNSITGPEPEPVLDARRLGDEQYVRLAIIAALGDYTDAVQSNAEHGPAFRRLMVAFRYLANMTGLHWAALMQSALLEQRYYTQRPADYEEPGT